MSRCVGDAAVWPPLPAGIADPQAEQAERAEFRALLAEWEEGIYDGPDFMRLVRLALHGHKGLRRVK